jgi:hypothetical protein
MVEVSAIPLFRLAFPIYKFLRLTAKRQYMDNMATCFVNRCLFGDLAHVMIVYTAIKGMK